MNGTTVHGLVMRTDMFARDRALSTRNCVNPNGSCYAAACDEYMLGREEVFSCIMSHTTRCAETPIELTVHGHPTPGGNQRGLQILLGCVFLSLLCLLNNLNQLVKET